VKPGDCVVPTISGAGEGEFLSMERKKKSHVLWGMIVIPCSLTKRLPVMVSGSLLLGYQIIGNIVFISV
jgi:hypothetical protein